MIVEPKEPIGSTDILGMGFNPSGPGNTQQMKSCRLDWYRSRNTTPSGDHRKKRCSSTDCTSRNKCSVPTALRFHFVLQTRIKIRAYKIERAYSSQVGISRKKYFLISDVPGTLWGTGSTLSTLITIGTSPPWPYYLIALHTVGRAW